MVIAIATIHDRETGEFRQALNEYATAEIADFVWSEGKESCDCNRAWPFRHDVVCYEDVWKGERYELVSLLIG